MVLDIIPGNSQHATVRRQFHRANIAWILWYLTIIGATLATGLFMLYIEPVPVPVGALIFGGTVVAVAYRPRYGLYLVMFFSLLGDSLLWPWYPFVKNLSSRESILFISNAVYVSPMEIYVLLVTVVWLGKAAMQRKFTFFRGELFGALLAFGVFMVFGLLYGLGTGGDVNIAMWAVRPILIMPIVALLVSNLMEKPAHVVTLMWWIMAALFIEGLAGTYYYFVDLGGDLGNVEAITEHAAAIHMNSLFVFAIAIYLYRSTLAHRILIPLMVPAVLLTYLVTQRRAAFISLGVAIAFIFLLLYRQHRKFFWIITPITVFLGIVYLGVFWNANGALAAPASAVRSIIAPDVNSADYSSNVYRVLENINDIYTVHAAPLTGVGFGNKFHIIVPMPDISFFVWWEYIVHNSIIWIWMETGVFGFTSMIFLVGLSITNGVRAIWRIPNNSFRAVVLTATLYIVMHFLYAYVDMSWDVQSMLYVGTMLGVINCAEHISHKLEEAQPQRWPRRVNAVSDIQVALAAKTGGNT